MGVIEVLDDEEEIKSMMGKEGVSLLILDKNRNSLIIESRSNITDGVSLTFDLIEEIRSRAEESDADIVKIKVED